MLLTRTFWKRYRATSEKDSGVARVVVLGGQKRAPKARDSLGRWGVMLPRQNFEIYVPANAILCVSWVRFCRKNFTFCHFIMHKSNHAYWFHNHRGNRFCFANLPELSVLRKLKVGDSFLLWTFFLWGSTKLNFVGHFKVQIMQNSSIAKWYTASFTAGF